MALPSEYCWTYWKGGYVTNSYYTIYLKSIYGKTLGTFKVTKSASTNSTSERSGLANICGLNLSYYGSSYIDEPLVAEPILYRLAYSNKNPSFNKSFYANKVYDGVNLGLYTHTRDIDLVGRQGNFDEDLYFYQNGFVYVFDQNEKTKIELKQGSILESSTLTKGYEVYVLKDTRIETDCCIDYLGQPTVYKKKGT